MSEEETTDDIFQRVRRLEVHARRLVNQSLSGEYHSSFKGQGLDFDDFREYQPGDDPRFIDWNVSARLDTPYIRQFREERELSVVLAIDVSASANYGSHHDSKRERAAELAALLGFSAQQNGDKVGLLLFAKEPLLYLPPSKKAGTTLRLMREILSSVPEHEQEGTSINEASQFLIRTLKRTHLIFLISDFIDWGFEKSLASLSRQHDLISLHLTDPLEKELPDVGKVILRDAESDQLVEINTSNPNVRMAYRKLGRRYREGLRAFFKKHAIDHLEISTTGSYLPSLRQLLRSRSRRS